MGKNKPKYRGGDSINPSGIYWMAYILPALIAYLFFMLYPLIDSIRLSFYEGALRDRTFVGFANYVKLFTDPKVSFKFWNAFRNTWKFFAFHMCIQYVLGMLFAVILTNRTMKGRNVYQTIIFLPCTIAILVTGYLFKLMLNPVWIGPTFRSLGLGNLVQPWLGKTESALNVVALISCWQWMGIPTMMFVAAIQGISEDLMEASAIEGADAWKQFWYIKLPLIMPAVGMIAILTFVSNFNAFDIVFAMQGPEGPPQYSTDLIGTLFYRTGITGEHPIGIPEPGLGSAISTSIFIMLMIGVVPTMRSTMGKE